MYDIKTVESGDKDQDIVANYCSNNSSYTAESTELNQSIMPLRRRRIFQRQACLISVMAAFSLGLALGVFIPMIGMSAAFTSDFTTSLSQQSINKTTSTLVQTPQHPESNFPTIYEIRSTNDHEQILEQDKFSVSFVKDKKLPAEEVFRNAFHLEQDKSTDDTMIVKKLDANDGSIKEFRVQRTSDGYFRKGPERRLSKPSVAEQVLSSGTNSLNDHISVEFVPIKSETAKINHNHPKGVIKDDIYWGELVEKSLPKGFNTNDANTWNTYVQNGVVTRLETGCGRMQNRMIIFNDGTRACARYRQNTDQIQGEIFSFYLGQLLNLTNLAPSATSVIDLDTETWSNAAQDITNAQWKSSRPVVLTKWLPDLEPAGIPTPFQPLERHLNKFDVWNITLGIDVSKPSKGLLDRLGAIDDQSKRSADITTTAVQNDAGDHIDKDRSINSTILNRLIELAQWSDLIVFDYLIANLDRVVNNLYNYQWNADIMAAPAHNLARQTNSQLLVFLDNESGLLHGYRLLKKYEAYHGLLLDNLCVFRQPTIFALQQLRDYGAGHQLQQLFERSTSHQVRDVLPSLPDKSIKILIDRIDRVLGQVQKCRDLFSDR